MSEGSPLPPQTDPLSQAYTGFCDHLFNHAAVTALVKPDNRIRFDTKNPEPDKYEKAAADCPELKVELQSWKSGSTKTCSARRGTLTFMLRIDSGDQRLNRGLLPVIYAVQKALAEIEGGANCGPYCKGVSQDQDGFGSLIDFQQTDGMKAWSAFVRVILTLEFPRDMP